MGPGRHEEGGAPFRFCSETPVFIDQIAPRGGPDPWFLPFGLQIGPEDRGAKVAFISFFVDRIGGRRVRPPLPPTRYAGTRALTYIGL